MFIVQALGAFNQLLVFTVHENRTIFFLEMSKFVEKQCLNCSNINMIYPSFKQQLATQQELFCIQKQPVNPVLAKV